MRDNVVKYDFNRLSITTQHDIGQDCGIVDIPHLGLKVNGAWNWGPHNQRKPGTVGILLGALQVLGSYFNEHVLEGDPKNYHLGVLAIKAVLSHEVLGDIKLEVDPNHAVLKTMVMYEGREYDVTRSSNFEVTRGMYGLDIYVKTNISWKDARSTKEVGITTTLCNDDVITYFQKRTTKDLAVEYIREHGVIG